MGAREGQHRDANRSPGLRTPPPYEAIEYRVNERKYIPGPYGFATYGRDTKQIDRSKTATVQEQITNNTCKTYSLNEHTHTFF